jgi:uncharacterized RDD family membrane protein YckC
MNTFVIAASTDPNPALAYTLIGMMMLITLLYVVFWIWMLVDAIRNEPPGSNERFLWPLAILLFGPITAFIYNISRRKQRIKLYGK